jgi:peptidyl-prolyl cis-trans isomerase D
MLRTMREGSAYFIKGVMLVVVLAFVGTIFVVWGVKSTPGDLAGRGIIASVGDTAISTDEYAQAYRRQVEMYRQVLGDKLDEKTLESMNLKQQVLERLIRRALVLEYAEAQGIQVGRQELASEITRIPVFAGKDGFSRQRYLDLLRANRLTPERFERDLRQDLVERKVEGLVREAAKVSDAEAKEQYQRVRRRLTVEVVQLPAGEEGKKKADAITVSLGKGGGLAAAAREAGVPVKQLGPFPAAAPPADIPDPVPVRQALATMKVGETSTLIAGEKASYLLRLAAEQEPPAADFEKEKEAFAAQLLAFKREMVFADWLNQVRREAKVTVDFESL